MKEPKTQLSDVMTGLELRRYISTLNTEKCPYAHNKLRPERRVAAKQALDEFLKMRWKRLRDEPQQNLEMGA